MITDAVRLKANSIFLPGLKGESLAKDFLCRTPQFRSVSLHSQWSAINPTRFSFCTHWIRTVRGNRLVRNLRVIEVCARYVIKARIKRSSYGSEHIGKPANFGCVLMTTYVAAPWGMVFHWNFSVLGFASGPKAPSACIAGIDSSLWWMFVKITSAMGPQSSVLKQYCTTHRPDASCTP